MYVVYSVQSLFLFGPTTPLGGGALISSRSFDELLCAGPVGEPPSKGINYLTQRIKLLVVRWSPESVNLVVNKLPGSLGLSFSSCRTHTLPDTCKRT